MNDATSGTSDRPDTGGDVPSPTDLPDPEGAAPGTASGTGEARTAEAQASPAQPAAEPVAAGQAAPGWGPPGPPPQWTAAWGPPPQGGHPPPGYPQAGYGTYGPPPTGPWPAGAAGPWPPQGPRRTGRGLLWIGIGVGAVILLVAALVVGVSAFGGGDPDDAVSAAADDLREWEGITYRGEVRQYSGGDVTVDLTVDRNGDVAGTLTRPDGARADYARLNGIELFKGEASWWRGESREQEKVQRLAGVWVRDPSTEVSGLSNQIAGPEEVASDLLPPSLGSSSVAVYRETGTREVAGETGRVLEGIARKVVVSQGSSPRVLAVVPMTAETPLEVSRAEPAALGLIGERAPERDKAPEYIKALTEQPRVTAQVLNAAPVCTTSECTATVRVTNASRFDASGSVQVTVNGRSADFETFQLAPNQSRDIAVSARNPASATPGRTVPIRWEAKVSAY